LTPDARNPVINLYKRITTVKFLVAGVAFQQAIAENAGQALKMRPFTGFLLLNKNPIARVAKWGLRL
jgi:hypothetical protein